MPKLEIKQQKIFSINGETSEFGNVSATENKDLDVIQSAAFEGGFADAVQPNETPTLEDVNSALYVTSRQLAYLQQKGIFEYLPTVGYYTGDLVRENGTTNVYLSLTGTDDGVTDNPNINNPLNDGINWKFAFDLASVNSGLNMDYIEDTIVWTSSTTLTWEGSAKSEDNTTDLISSSAITGTLAGAAVSSTYFMFIGLDSGSTLIAEFDTNFDGSGLTNITGAKRRVLAIITDGVGGIIPFAASSYGRNIRISYNTFIQNEDRNTDVSGLLTTTVPQTNGVRGLYLLGGYVINTAFANQILEFGDYNISGTTGVTVGTYTNGMFNQELQCNSLGQIFRARRAGQNNARMQINTVGYNYYR